MNTMLEKYLPLYSPDEIAGGGDGGGGGAGETPPDNAAAADTLLSGDAPGNDDDKTEDKSEDKTEDKSDDDNSDDKSDKSEGDEKGKEKTDQAPETLALQAPEGFEDFQEDFDKFSSDMDGWLKANPDAKPADVLAEAARRQADVAKTQAEENLEAFKTQVDTWGNEARADKEIGGDDFDKNVAVGIRAVEEFGTPELKNLLNESGLGNHPEFIRFAFKAGKQLNESSVVKATGGTKDTGLTEALYGGD